MDDVELGIEAEMDWREMPLRRRCGCTLPAGQDHDEDDCLQEQADWDAENDRIIALGLKEPW